LKNNIIQRLFPKLFAKALPFPFSVGTRYEIINGQIITPHDNKRSYFTQGYNINDTIYSIIQLITEKVKIAPWNVYKVTDEEALKRYTAIMMRKNVSPDDVLKAKSYRKKALELYDQDQRLKELLMWPNGCQTFADLVADSAIYKLLTGDRLIWGNMLKAGANSGKPFELHILPSQEISIIVTKTYPQEIIAYKLDPVAWEKLSIPKEEVLHDKYFNPNADINGTHLLGLAPMKAALGLTTRSNSENRSATMAFQNGGPRSVLFMDDQRFSGEEGNAQAKEIKRILTSTEYTGPDAFNKFATSGYKMGVVPIGLSPVELNIIESEKWSLRRFCNVFGGVPSQLLNDPDNRHYNNYVEGERALTSRCAIPLLNSFRDHFNRKLATDWGYKGKNIYIDYDMTVYTELQENMGDKWEWIKQLPVSNGYKMDLMGLDHEEGQEEFMEQILIPTGFDTAENISLNETDRALQEETGDEFDENSDEEISQDSSGKELQKGGSKNGFHKRVVL
jgi:HK97 family phage portal protein